MCKRGNLNLCTRKILALINTYFLIPLILVKVSIDQLFSTQGNCIPRGHMAMSGDTFGCHNREGSEGIY